MCASVEDPQGPHAMDVAPAHAPRPRSRSQCEAAVHHDLCTQVLQENCVRPHAVNISASLVESH